MKKRQPIQARCYRDNIPIGVMTLTEWEDVLDVEYNKIFRAYKNGGVTKTEDGAKLRFEPVGQDDEEYKMSLSEAEELARGEGKSYGQMQAEKYLRDHPIIPKAIEEPEELEEPEKEEMEEMLEDVTVEDLNWEPVMTMREFAEAYVGDAAFYLYTREFGKDVPVCLIPSDSPALPIFGDVAVTGFMIEPGTSHTMRIYVKMEDEG